MTDDGSVNIQPFTEKIWDNDRNPPYFLKVIGVRPTVGGKFSDPQSNRDRSGSWYFCYLPEVLTKELKWGKFQCETSEKNVRKTVTNSPFYLFSSNTGVLSPSDTIGMGDYVRIHKGHAKDKRDFRVTAISFRDIQAKGDQAKWLVFDQFVDNNGKDENGQVPELIGAKHPLTDPNKRSDIGNRRDASSDCNASTASKVLCNALDYVVGTKQFVHPGVAPCATYVTRVLVDSKLLQSSIGLCATLHDVLGGLPNKFNQVFATPAFPIAQQRRGYLRYRSGDLYLGRTLTAQANSRTVGGDILIYNDWPPNNHGSDGHHHSVIAGGYGGDLIELMQNNSERFPFATKTVFDRIRAIDVNKRYIVHTSSHGPNSFNIAAYKESTRSGTYVVISEQQSFTPTGPKKKNYHAWSGFHPR